MYLLAVITFEKEDHKPDTDKLAICKLGIAYPIVIEQKKDPWFIGN